MSEVAWSDQKEINEFSKLNARLTQHEKAVEGLSQDRDAIQDAQLELELVDEDEKLPYRLGDSFVLMPQSSVMERLESDQSEIEERIESRQKERDAVVSRMDELKTALYAKFGQNNINLER